MQNCINFTPFLSSLFCHPIVTLYQSVRIRRCPHVLKPILLIGTRCKQWHAITQKQRHPCQYQFIDAAAMYKFPNGRPAVDVCVAQAFFLCQFEDVRRRC